MDSPVASNSVAKTKVPWGPISAVVFSVTAFFLSQIIAGLIVSVYPLLKHWNAHQTTDWLSNSIYAQFFFVVFAEGMLLVWLWQFLNRRGANFKTLGFNNRRPKLSDVGQAIMGFIIYFAIYIIAVTVLQRVFPHLNVDQKQQTGFEHAAGGSQLILVFISLVVLPPLVEEIVTRGFMYQGLKTKLPKIMAILITSVLFAAAHLQFGSGASLLWIAAIDTFSLSLVLIYLFEETGSLWASMMLHMSKNLIAFLTLFVFR